MEKNDDTRSLSIRRLWLSPVARDRVYGLTSADFCARDCMCGLTSVNLLPAIWGIGPVARGHVLLGPLVARASRLDCFLSFLLAFDPGAASAAGDRRRRGDATAEARRRRSALGLGGAAAMEARPPPRHAGRTAEVTPQPHRACRKWSGLTAIRFFETVSGGHPRMMYVGVVTIIDSRSCLGGVAS